MVKSEILYEGSTMLTQQDALRLMLGAVIAMREAGYTQEDVQELASEAWGYEGGGQPC